MVLFRKREKKKILSDLYKEAYLIQEENNKKKELAKEEFNSKYAHCELEFVSRNNKNILKLFDDLGHTKSEKYHYNRKQVIKQDLEDVTLYEFDEFIRDCRYEYDPNNKRDPETIRIYCEECFIGYVPRDFRDEFEIYKDCPMRVKIIGGRYRIYETVFSLETEDYEVHLFENTSSFKAVLLIEK